MNSRMMNYVMTTHMHMCKDSYLVTATMYYTQNGKATSPKLLYRLETAFKIDFVL